MTDQWSAGECDWLGGQTNGQIDGGKRDEMDRWAPQTTDPFSFHNYCSHSFTHSFTYGSFN